MLQASEQALSKQGEEIYGWAKDLFPLCRSLTGKGVQDTLTYFQNLIPDLAIKAIPSGTKVFDWEVPNEWNIKEAWIKDPQGKKIIDFKHNNLHVVSYSEPIHKVMELEELENYLHSLPHQPTAIPYITSYYKRRWGFCLNDQQRTSLKKGRYEVYIDSTLQPGMLHYADLLISGETKEEILFSTYICHPSMGNNELSGPCVATAAIRWLQKINPRRYSYRFLFIPETIGSIIYLSQNLAHLKQSLKAGFVLSCLGDERAYSFVSTPQEDTLADKIADHIYAYQSKGAYTKYSFTGRGSDERQYCSPGIDLPVVAICKSKYGTYPEYHTSLDDLSLITSKGLQEGLDLVRHIILALENNKIYKTTTLCEPQLGKRGLYPTLSTKETAYQMKNMMNLLAYSNGQNSLLEIANKTNQFIGNFYELANTLLKHNLLRET